MSPYQGSGANSPAIGGHQPPPTSASPATIYSSSALAYANAQLSHFAATGGAAAALPAHLNPHTLSAALSDYSMSMPNSAASSPGATPRRLPGTGASTPGGNSRVAASAITGKRLNWSEMICQTIAESESGRLVIQDLFEGMCSKFPEIREWAFGKDWEARVKNRIKSTLSIKGNLFIKVPRPSSAAGKGSWWTLSAEAQEAWKTGRVANVVKGNGHSRAASAGPSSIHGSPVRAAQAKFGILPTNPHLPQHSQHASQRTSPLGLGLNNTHHHGLSTNFSTGSPDNQAAAALAAKRAKTMEDSLNDNQGLPSTSQASFNSLLSMPSNAFGDLSFLQGTTGSDTSSQPFGAPQSVAHLGGPQSMPFPANNNTNIQQSNANNGMLGMNNFAFTPNYSTLFDSLSSFGQGGMGAGLGNDTSGLDMGLPFNLEDGMPHPFGGSIPGAYTLLQGGQQDSSLQDGNGPNDYQYQRQDGSRFYGNAIGNNQSQGLNSRSDSDLSNFYGQAQSNDPSSLAGGPSPADSTGSAFFNYTPLVQASGQIGGAAGVGMAGSALGQLGGEGSKKRRASEALKEIGDFHLPPAEARAQNSNTHGN
ncbi:hypothetical protein IE53DRAFT_313814 [Violaceomyces palustris]|uniref:Uncharacterized protein n=1 Tax=Violaceomyces palustris TaxID=1673888 RepID=A0ACD0P0G9_9BASI|nr:hypothetical protein IE53DRAFT_313814 [Violaceomyces palustris]